MAIIAITLSFHRHQPHHYPHHLQLILSASVVEKEEASFELSLLAKKHTTMQNKLHYLAGTELF